MYIFSTMVQLQLSGSSEDYGAHCREFTTQPQHHTDLAPSVLEYHASELCKQQDWNAEWNALGLPSKLSEQVSTIFHDHNTAITSIITYVFWLCFKGLL